MTQHLPQYLVMAWLSIELGYVIGNHGKPKREPNFNGWYSTINVIIFEALLLWGGFFRGM